MRYTMHALMLAIGLATFGHSRCLAADIAWGNEVDGLRMGVSLSTDGLSVFVENVGSSKRAVLLGSSSWPKYKFGFSATDMDGTEYQVIDLEGRSIASGYGGPTIVRLNPSGSHEVKFSFERFSVVRRGSNRFSPDTQRFKLKDLISQGAKVRVRFAVTPAMIAERHYGYQPLGSDAWIGDLTSGDINGSQIP